MAKITEFRCDRCYRCTPAIEVIPDVCISLLNEHNSNADFQTTADLCTACVAQVVATIKAVLTAGEPHAAHPTQQDVGRGPSDAPPAGGSYLVQK